MSYKILEISIPKIIEMPMMMPLHFILSRSTSTILYIPPTPCVLIQFCGTECWKIQNLAGQFLIRFFWFGKSVELRMLENFEVNKTRFFLLQLAGPGHAKISENA